MNRPGRHLLLGAAAAGLVHAAFSLYWALGGRWLLGTVGQWAVDLSRDRPVAAGTALTVIAGLKAAGALLPVLATGGRVRWPRLWRRLAWPGSVLLAGYGGVNAIVANLVLAGGIQPDGGYDRPAMIGHALLWDPLFLIWGLLLAAGLYTTRGQPPRTPRPTAHRQEDASS
jgi:Protein of unknown function (DUF3995)